MSTQSYVYHHRVTYADCTIGNHVYYSRYLDILEAARGEFFRFLDQPLFIWQERDTIFPVIEAHFRYKAPARYDDLLTVQVTVAALDRIRLSFGYLVRDHETRRELLRATTAHVCTSTHEKPKRIPDDLAAALKPFLDIS